MANPKSPEGKREVCLRTTANVLEHALKQLMYCAVMYPEYMDEATSVRHLTEKVVEHARQFGYVGGGN